MCVWTEIGKVWEGGAYSFPIITLQLYILSVPCRRALENILLNNKWSHIHHRNKRLSNKGEHKSQKSNHSSHTISPINFNPKLYFVCLCLFVCHYIFVCLCVFVCLCICLFIQPIVKSCGWSGVADSTPDLDSWHEAFFAPERPSHQSRAEVFPPFSPFSSSTNLIGILSNFCSALLCFWVSVQFLFWNVNTDGILLGAQSP